MEQIRLAIDRVRLLLSFSLDVESRVKIHRCCLCYSFHHLSLELVSDKSLFCSGNMKELLLMTTLATVVTHEILIKTEFQSINSIHN